MPYTLRSLVFSLSFAVFALPGGAQETPSPDTVVATVNGTEITLGHMIAARATLPAEYSGIPDEELYNGILTQLVQQEALAQSADGVSPFTARTLENEQRSIRAQEALLSNLEDAVSEEDIQATYDEQFKDFVSTEEYNASHILVPTQEEAQAIKEELDAGANFAATARERSTGPSAPNGGELGWFGTGAMVPTFEAATIALSIGEVSEPVETQFGWHVIRLNDARTSVPPPLDEMRERIVAELQRSAASGIIDSTTDAASVVIAEDTGIDPAILARRDLLEQ